MYWKNILKTEFKIKVFQNSKEFLKVLFPGKDHMNPNQKNPNQNA